MAREFLSVSALLSALGLPLALHLRGGLIPLPFLTVDPYCLFLSARSLVVVVLVLL